MWEESEQARVRSPSWGCWWRHSKAPPAAMTGATRKWGRAAEEQRSKFPTSPVHILWILELKSRGHLRPADFEDGFGQEAQWGPLRRMLMPR
ncbi:rCG34744 [Rattus norvegicus]|uniref:RCG34744 n=1 Tax=Rattus norvegicus TaxID=10116 RepID=A6HKH9_RAT|nr:rCG34744 [Rattus norvegicus]